MKSPNFKMFAACFVLFINNGWAKRQTHKHTQAHTHMHFLDSELDHKLHKGADCICPACDSIPSV